VLRSAARAGVEDAARKRTSARRRARVRRVDVADAIASLKKRSALRDDAPRRRGFSRAARDARRGGEALRREERETRRAGLVGRAERRDLGTTARRSSASRA
jgi:hypothetical protein